MEAYKREFIEFLVRSGALTFGDFTTKSGRKTPFFINTGKFDTGAKISRLGEYYAQALAANLGTGFDCLFGPAYKGIPLATAAAGALAQKHGRDIFFCFNRKEAKDHGEGGEIVGHKPAKGERVAIIEDVTTAGTSVRETVALFKAFPESKLVGLVVSVDRQERGSGSKSALAEIREEFGMKTFAIATLAEIVEHLEKTPVDGKLHIDADMRQRIDAYRAQYGAVE